MSNGILIPLIILTAILFGTILWLDVAEKNEKKEAVKKLHESLLEVDNKLFEDLMTVSQYKSALDPRDKRHGGADYLISIFKEHHNKSSFIVSIIYRSKDKDTLILEFKDEIKCLRSFYNEYHSPLCLFMDEPPEKKYI